MEPPMSNTTQRILSAVVLMMVVTACFVMGAKVLSGFILVAGLIAVDELQINFLQRLRTSPLYGVSMALFIAPMIYFAFLETGPAILKVGVNAAVLLNILLLVYLFYIDMDSSFLPKLFTKLPLLAALLITLPCLSLVYLLKFPEWQEI